LALPVRGYVPVYDQSGSNFFCELVGDYSMPTLAKGIIEKVVKFSIYDFYLVPEAVQDNNINKIQEVILNPFVNVEPLPKPKTLYQFPNGFWDNNLIWTNNLIYG
jgi:hypothetical protein